MIAESIIPCALIRASAFIQKPLRRATRSLDRALSYAKNLTSAASKMSVRLIPMHPSMNTYSRASSEVDIVLALLIMMETAFWLLCIAWILFSEDLQLIPRSLAKILEDSMCAFKSKSASFPKIPCE